MKNFCLPGHVFFIQLGDKLMYGNNPVVQLRLCRPGHRGAERYHGIVFARQCQPFLYPHRFAVPG